MSRIRAKSGLDRELFDLLKSSKVKFKKYPRLPMNPDAYLIDHDIAIFADGCFWHGCKEHFKLPKSNREFWKEKILYNRQRDKQRAKLPYTWIRLWEHQLR